MAEPYQHAMIAQGKANRCTAAELILSVTTVEYHLKNVYAKLGINSRGQLVLRSAAGSGDAETPQT